MYYVCQLILTIVSNSVKHSIGFLFRSAQCFKAFLNATPNNFKPATVLKMPPHKCHLESSPLSPFTISARLTIQARVGRAPYFLDWFNGIMLKSPISIRTWPTFIMRRMIWHPQNRMFFERTY